MTRYCLDTSVLVNGWHKTYAPEFAQPFWDFLSEMLASGAAVIPREAYEELTKQDDDLLKWVKARIDLVRDADEAVVLALKAIMQHEDYCKIVKFKGTGRSGADPWVIAHAQVLGATVVAEESNGSPKEPRIPDVCNGLGVPFIRTGEMLKAEKFHFK